MPVLGMAGHAVALDGLGKGALLCGAGSGMPATFLGEIFGALFGSLDLVLVQGGLGAVQGVGDVSGWVEGAGLASGVVEGGVLQVLGEGGQVLMGVGDDGVVMLGGVLGLDVGMGDVSGSRVHADVGLGWVGPVQGRGAQDVAATNLGASR